jgi:hypothetical protein
MRHKSARALRTGAMHRRFGFGRAYHELLSLVLVAVVLVFVTGMQAIVQACEWCAMIQASELPSEALLRKYREAGAYADCYAAEMDRPVFQAEYVEAFYTTWVFKLERLLLGWLVAKPSTDAQARALACGELEAFAAWTVEARAPDQLLLCDFQGRTRSWLMSVPVPGNAARTRLYFGSAVVPVHNARSGATTMGWAFRALLGFHKIYSHVLLGAAVARLQRHGRASSNSTQAR